MGKNREYGSTLTEPNLAFHELSLLLNVAQELLRNVSEESRSKIIAQIKESMREESLVED